MRASILFGFVVAGSVGLSSACLSGYVFDGGPAGASSTGTLASTSSAIGPGSTSTTSGMGGESASTSSVSTSSGGGSGTTSGTPTSSSSSSGSPCTTADCSNPDCASAYKCVQTTPPTGWSGYYRLYDGATTAPGCDSAWPMTVYDGNATIQASDATCTCNCDPATGETCAITGPADPNVSGDIDEVIVQDAACGQAFVCGGGLATPPGWNGACASNGYFMAGATNCGPNSNSCVTSGEAPCNVAIAASPLSVSGGSCTASGPTVVVPPPTWAKYGEACGMPTPGTGCSLSSDTCLPIPASPFVPGVCIMQTGTVECPPVFTKQFVYDDPSMTVDTRGCEGTCTCGSPSGGDCSATIKIHSDTGGCTGPVLVTLSPTASQGDCQALSGNPEVGSLSATFKAGTPGSCTGSGSTPMGSATAAGPTTFCCIP